MLTRVQECVAARQRAAPRATLPSARVTRATPATPSGSAQGSRRRPYRPRSSIPATPHRAAQMPGAARETVPRPASAFLNTLAIRTLHVGQNVWSTQTVRLTKHVGTTSALILVLEPAVSMPCALSETMCRHVPASRITLGTPSLHAERGPSVSLEMKYLFCI